VIQGTCGVIQGTFGVIQGTFGVIQGTCGVIQGTCGVIQGTFGVIQGTCGVIQGTCGVIQGTFAMHCFYRWTYFPAGFAGLLVYCIGIPLFTAVFLYTNSAHLESPLFKKRYGPALCRHTYMCPEYIQA
jgi:hypothetical protein